MLLLLDVLNIILNAEQFGHVIYVQVDSDSLEKFNEYLLLYWFFNAHITRQRENDY